MKKVLLVIVCLIFISNVDAKKKVFLIGDSTCSTKDLKKGNPERGWGHMIAPFFDDNVIVENHARNGRSSKSFKTLGHWDVVEERMDKGDYLFIQFAHNDSKKSDTLRYASPEDYAKNIIGYIESARAKGVKPILLTPVVRRYFKKEGLTGRHGEYTAQMKRIAKEYDVTLLDMEQITWEWLNELGDSLSRQHFMWIKEGTNPLYPDGKIDNTHYTVSGARIVARMVIEQIRENIEELAPYTRDWDIVVAKDGSGDFFTLQEAVDVASDYAMTKTTIYVCNGTYNERVNIPASKENLHIVGQNKDSVIFSYANYSAKLNFVGKPMGTSGSATMYVDADNFRAENITIANTAGEVGQAVAIMTTGDNICFSNCRFLGNQDTLYAAGEGNRENKEATGDYRNWFDNCYIEGTTDFIFGSATALFTDCVIYSKKNSYITAASTNKGQKYGFVFIDCKLDAGEGITKCYLGRPWRDYAQTIFIDCELGSHIRPEGWHNWNKPHAEKSVFYAEAGSKGLGANQKSRVGWSKQLELNDAKKRYTVSTIMRFENMDK